MLTRLLALLSLTLAAAAQGMNSYSLPDDVAMGDQMASEVLSRVRTLDSPTVQEYVARLGRQLALQAPEPPFSYRFTVVESLPLSVNLNSTHEAAPLPGGQIIVPAQLILAVRNTPELAAMLAHAIAHVADRDCTRNLTRGQVSQIGAAATSMQCVAGVVPGPMVPSYLQYQRGFERQADSVAVRILSAAGFDPAALGAYIERVQTGESKIFTTLPDAKTRVADMQAQIAKLTPGQKYSEGEELGPIQSEVRAVLAKMDQVGPKLDRQAPSYQQKRLKK